MTGVLTDQNGRPIPGVTVTLVNRSAQTKHEVKSDSAGHYEIVGVSAGTYELLFEQPGMATLKPAFDLSFLPDPEAATCCWPG